MNWAIREANSLTIQVGLHYRGAIWHTRFQYRQLAIRPRRARGFQSARCFGRIRWAGNGVRLTRLSTGNSRSRAYPAPGNDPDANATLLEFIGRHGDAAIVRRSPKRRAICSYRGAQTSDWNGLNLGVPRHMPWRCARLLRTGLLLYCPQWGTLRAAGDAELRRRRNTPYGYSRPFSHSASQFQCRTSAIAAHQVVLSSRS